MRATVERARVDETPYGRLHIIVVVQGLAHAHEDEIVGSQAERARRVDLLHDLIGAEIAHEPHASGGAEGAAHAAADLGRDAESRALLGSVAFALAHRDDDRLDERTVGQARCELHHALGAFYASDVLYTIGKIDDRRCAVSIGILGVGSGWAFLHGARL